MPSYWGIRTSKEMHEFIGDELAKGVLRQGWGSRDLRVIGEEVAAGTADDDARSVWRYTQRMLDVEVDDVVLTPHQPEWGGDGVWRVVGKYEFDPIPDPWGEGWPDFGHILRVEPLGLIDPRSARVTSGLRRALTTGFRPRMRQLHDFGPEIEALLHDPEAAQAAGPIEQFEAMRKRARDALGNALLQQYGNADFEQPIGAMLETLYPGAVAHTAGPGEERERWYERGIEIYPGWAHDRKRAAPGRFPWSSCGAPARADDSPADHGARRRCSLRAKAGAAGCPNRKFD